MPIARFQLPDGRIARFEVPDGTTPEQAEAAISKHMSNRQQPATADYDPTKESYNFVPFGIDTGIKLPNSLALGLAGAGKAAVDAYRGARQLASYVGIGDEKAIQAEIDAAKELDKPLMNTGAGMVGNIAGNAALALAPGGVLKGAGALVSKAPMLAKAGGILTAAGEGLNAAKTMKGAAAAGATLGALAPVASDEGRIGNMAMGAAGGAIGQKVGSIVGNQLAKAAQRRASVETSLTAQELPDIQAALAKSGIDFDGLSDAAKNNVAKYYRQAINTGGEIAPDEAARAALLASLPKPIKGTKGQLSQNYVQQEREALLSDSGFFGEKFRSAREQQRQLVSDNFDELTKATGGEGVNLQRVGENYRGGLQSLYDAEKANVSGLYKQAEEAAGGKVVAAPQLVKWFEENAGLEGVDALAGRAKALGIIGERDGRYVARPVELKRLNELRKTATAATLDGGTKGYYAGGLKSQVDDLFEQLGGAEYKTAIAARREMGRKFGGSEAVAKLLEMKNMYRGTDKVSDEKVFNSLLFSGSNKELRHAVSLGADVKDLRAAAIQHLKDKGMEEVNGKMIIRPATMKRELERIGQDKLKTLLGPEMAAKINDVVTAAQILERKQPSLAGGSQTASRLANMGNMFINLLDKVPAVGPALKHTAKAAQAATHAKAATQPFEQRLAKSLVVNDPRAAAARNALQSFGIGAAPAAQAYLEDQ